MDEFKSEEIIKPDSNDRHTHRHKKNRTVQRQVSKQHVLIGISILILLIIIISSAIKSQSLIESTRQSADNNSQSNIDCFGSTTNPSSDANTHFTGTKMPAGIAAPDNGATRALSTPIGTETQLSRTPRTELPGNMVNSLSKQENFVNGIASRITGQEPVSTRSEQKNTIMMPSYNRQTSGATKSLSSPDYHTAISTVSPSVNVGGGIAGSIQHAPAGYYTLQLSSASQPATLNVYARKQQLSNYWIYETCRDGRPWYVLVNGIYPSISQAKNAVDKLPADVKVKRPWIRQIGQVQQELNN